MMLTLQFEQVRAFLVDVWSFGLEHLVKALALETAPSDGEVDKGDTGAYVRGKLHSRVSC